MKITLLLTLSATTLTCMADDFASYDFSVRFPTALSHFTPFGEVAGKGGTVTASIWGTSPNPASVSWGFQNNPCTHPSAIEADYALSAQYSALQFDEGQEIRFLTQAMILDLAEAGVVRLGFATADSNSEIIRGFPVTYNFDLIGTRLDWGYQVTEAFRIGLGVGYSYSETTFKAPLFDVIHTDRDSWGLRAGLSTRLDAEKNWLLGIMADYGQGRNDQSTLLPTPSGGLQAGRLKETVDQLLFRTGLARALDKHKTSWAHLDYEWSRYAIPSEALENHRFLLSADYLIKIIHVRAGVFTDARGNAGWSAALGIHLPKLAHIDLAYQNNAFPEVREEFGHSQTLNLSVALQW